MNPASLDELMAKEPQDLTEDEKHEIQAALRKRYAAQLEADQKKRAGKKPKDQTEPAPVQLSVDDLLDKKAE